MFLFDEPLSNLDAKLRVAMRTEIKALHQRLKTTSIYVTHDQIEAMTMADKIVVMNAGKVEQIGSPLELYDNPANLFVAGFIGSPAMNFLPGKRNGREVLARRAARAPASRLGATAWPPRWWWSSRPAPTRRSSARSAASDVTAVVRERHEFHPGEAIRLKPKLTYLFDPSSGARLA